MPARRIVPTVLLCALVALAIVPGIAVAHSELESSDPAAGATLSVSPTEIRGDFSEEVDPARSTMELRGPDDSRVATGGVPADGPPTRMVITALPTLAPGAYEVRWTTVTADDDGVERGTFSFTVGEAAAAAPTAPTAVASATPASSTAPSPAPAPAAGMGDLLLPIVVLVAVLVGGAIVLLRRRR